MKVRSRFACISAAVAAFMCAAGVTTAQARDLTWDANGAADPTGQDGSGAWELTNANWFDSDPVPVVTFVTLPASVSTPPP